MSDRRFEATLEATFKAPRDVVWALVADTNRWDRASGLSPGQYEWREIAGVRQRCARTRELGFEVEWVEPPYEWLEARLVRGARRFLKGPVNIGGFQAELSDTDCATLVTATAYVVGSGPLFAAVLGPVMRARFRAALDRYFAAIGQVLDRRDESRSSSVDEPAVTRVRRVLMEGYDSVTSGERTPPNQKVLVQRAQKVSARVEGKLRERIVGFLRDRPDEEVTQIRAFELADAWELERRDVLRAFLYSTEAGLVDLRWQINCPVCRVSASMADTLAEVGKAVHCEACNIDYDIDFGQHVEAVFQSSPAIRAVQPAVYCASSPAFRPHVYAQLLVAPGDERCLAADLPPGSFHVRTLRGNRSAAVDGLPALGSLSVTVHDGGLSAEGGDGGASEIRLRSDAKEPVVVLVERAGWSADAVLGSVIASFPEFMNLFATEAPAAGMDLAVGHLALLFTDLTGSTALYEQIGDARAYAIVQEHFHEMERVLQTHGGALVKTMGDAIMATFPSTTQAAAAAVDMIAANERTHGDLGLGVKVGIYAGPCLAVRANDRMDFFGTTVNMAARLQGQAKASEIVMTREQAAAEDVAAALSAYATEELQVSLRGIKDTQALVRFRCRGPRAAC